MSDIRYYAITYGGRQLLNAEDDEAAADEVETSYYLRKATKKIVRETREVILERTPI